MTYSKTLNNVDIIIKNMIFSKTWSQCRDVNSILGAKCLYMVVFYSFMMNVCLTYIVSESQTKISDTLRDTILK